MKRLLTFFITAMLILSSCSEEFTAVDAFGGKYTRIQINHLIGFTDNLPRLLEENGMSHPEYIMLSTSNAWEYPEETGKKLKEFRESIEFPTENTLFQKVIDVKEMDHYLNNLYDGALSGFIFSAADIKNIYTMEDIYWGLRLDYRDSEFRENGSTYAVIRFYLPKDEISCIKIPFCEELGGYFPHTAPYGGGGFTTSKLGLGGYPEYHLTDYIQPCAGAEIYEVNKNGYEIIRARFSEEGIWETIDAGYSPTTKASNAQKFSNQKALYHDHIYELRAIIDGQAHLRIFEPNSEAGLKRIEKGIWGLEVPEKDIVIL